MIKHVRILGALTLAGALALSGCSKSAEEEQAERLIEALASEEARAQATRDARSASKIEQSEKALVECKWELAVIDKLQEFEWYANKVYGDVNGSTPEYENPEAVRENSKKKGNRRLREGSWAC